jgi:hypothetical protein
MRMEREGLGRYAPHSILIEKEYNIGKICLGSIRTFCWSLALCRPLAISPRTFFIVSSSDVRASGDTGVADIDNASYFG